jgi:MscS family membrane protein
MRKIIFIAVCFLLIVNNSFAQQDTTFSSPYVTIYNHLYHLQNENYSAELSANSFGFELPVKNRVDQAIKMKQILDGKGLFVDMNLIPATNTYLDSLSKKNIYYLFPKELPQVFLEKKGNQWFYSDETIKNINTLHKKTFPFGTDYLLKITPSGKTQKLLGLNTWQYLGILILLLAGFLFFFLFKLLFKPILRKMSQMSFHIDLDDQKLLNKTSRVLSLLVVFVLVNFFIPALQLPVKWTLVAKRGVEILITVFVALLLLRVLEYLLNYFKSISNKTESKMDDQLMPIVHQLFKMIVIIGAIIQILNLMNVNVTALIAGISIGGLALALAAKDTVSNLIGSLMVFLDKPFQIGDFIEVGSYGGTVIEVGFRSTRIQTKDTSIISIPNGNIANTALVNKGIRVYRLFETNLGVTYDTPPELIEVFVTGLTKMVIQHLKVTNEDYYINLNGLGASSIDIIFRVYLNTTSYGEELRIKQDLILTILKLADTIGIRFAFPSSTLYVEELPGQKSLSPEYNKNKEQLDKKVDEFLSGLGDQ